MASFNSPQTLPVSEYKSSVNPELYGKVIATKQAQYDQGVEKINAKLSTIAGLPVVNEADKQYLNTVVQGLENNLQKLAGEDFSRQNNVNQALGLAAQIAKDPKLQAAVVSSNQYQKAIQEREAYAKAGKTDIKNDTIFNDKVNGYLNSKEAGASFNASYTPYYNVLGGFTDFLKKINPQSTITQNDIVENINGVPVIMTRESSKEGFTNQQIREAWNMFSQEGAVQAQLQINADFAFRGVPVGPVYNQLDQQIKTIEETTKQEIQDLRTRKSIDKTVGEAEVQAAIAQREKQAENAIADLRSVRNLDETTLKRTLYNQEFETDLINTFNKPKTSERVIDSVRQKALQAHLDYEQKLINKQEQSKKQKSGGLPDTQVIQRNNVEEEGKLGEATFKAALSSQQRELSNQKRKHVGVIAQFAGQKAPWILSPEGEYVPNVGPLGYKNKEEALQASNSLYAEARNAYTNGVAKPHVKSMFAEVDVMQKNVKAMETKAAEIDAGFDIPSIIQNNVEQAAERYPTVSNFLARKKSITLQDPTTQESLGNMPFSDLVKLATAIETKGIPAENAKKELLAKYENFDLPTLKAALYFQPEIRNLYGDVRNLIQESPEIVELIQGREQAYKSAQSAYISFQENWVAATPEEYRDIEQRVSGVIGQITKDKGTYNDFNEAIKEGSKDRSNLYGYYTDRASGKTYLTLQKPDGEILEVPISNIQANAIPGIKASDEFSSYYGSNLSLTGNTTTDISNLGEDPYPVVGDPNRQYDVKYHLVGSGNNTFMLKLYATDSNGKEVLNAVPYSSISSQMYMTPQQVLEAVNELKQDNIISSIIALNNPNQANNQ